MMIFSRNIYSLKEVFERAKEMFGGNFSPKLFRGQLSYFDDMDYSEEVDFIGKSYSQEEIQEFLIEVAIA